jgi:hypothetical protein
MEAVPHTPPADVVVKERAGIAAGDVAVGDVAAGDSVMSRTLYVFRPWPSTPSQYLISEMSSTAATSPSACRNPWTSSMSCPGVRIVTVSDRPPIRISSGSSPATTSGREVNTITPLWNRRTGVRTVTRLTGSACRPMGCRLTNAAPQGQRNNGILVLLRNAAPQGQWNKTLFAGVPAQWRTMRISRMPTESVRSSPSGMKSWWT